MWQRTQPCRWGWGGAGSAGEDAGPGSGGAGRWGGEADDAEDAEEGEILEMPQPDSKRSRWTDPFSDEEDEEPEATAAAGAAAGAAANPHENGASPLSAAMEDPDGDLNQRERLELAQSGDGDTQGSPGTSPHGRRQAPTPDGSAGRQPGDGEADAEAHTPPPQQLPRGSEASASPLLQHREAEGEAGRGHNMLMECRSITAYELGKRVAEGTYGIVFRGHVRGQPRKQVAIKKIKMQRGLEGFPLTSIREINIMLALKHPAIVNVSEVVVGKSMDDIYMVMDWMEYDLKYFLEKYGAGGAAGERRRLTIPQVKCIMLQLLAGLDYMHNNWVLHRDMKPSNILLNHIGEVKICDFGMARMYGSPLRNYTELVITRWYRPPELFCGQRQYDGAVDIWSLGAIMAELLTGQALFCNRSDNELSMIDTITDVMGSPCADNPWRSLEGMPHIRKGKLKAEAWFKGNKKCRLEEKLPMKQGMFDDLNTKLSAAGLDLLKRMLAFEPSQRVTAADALQHDWFTVDVPLACDKALLPTLGTERGAAHAHVPHRPPRLQPSPDAVQAQLAWPARGTLLRGAAPR